MAMTVEQEQRIFGNVLGDAISSFRKAIEIYNQLDIVLPPGLDDEFIYSAKIILQTERQRREAIGWTILTCIQIEKSDVWWIDEPESGGFDLDGRIQWLESTLEKPWPQIKAEWQGE